MEIFSGKTLALFLALIVAYATRSNGYSIGNILVVQARISGFVTCDLPAPPPPPEARPILKGVNVALVCNGIGYDVASTLTDAIGFYELVINTLDFIIFDPDTCWISVRLPIARCRIYPPTGTLRATFQYVRLLEPLTSAVAILSAGPLALVT